MKYIIFLILLTSNIALAYTLESFSFEKPEQEQAFRELSSELRCLVCQNENLAGSNAELAQDLRKEIYGMMQRGKSKQDIIDFMVARYGDFILYEPPLKKSTLILWFGPVLLLVLAPIVLVMTLRNRQQSTPKQLSTSDQEKIRNILNDTNKENSK